MNDFSFDIKIKATSQADADKKVRALLIVAQTTTGDNLERLANKVKANPKLVEKALKYV